jgi:hypothetical protein
MCVRVECGVEVVNVCWRHTTTPGRTWISFLPASGVDVRTLGGARGGAPTPWGEFFVIYRTRWGVVVLSVVREVVVKRAAQIPLCELNSNL